MGIFTKNKLLRAYGIGIGENLYERAKANSLNEDATFRGSLNSSLKETLIFLERNQSEKNKKIILEEIAGFFLEKNLIDYAHFLYEKSNPKKARYLESLLHGEEGVSMQNYKILEDEIKRS